VVINGNPVLTNLDVFKAAGGKDIAYDPHFTASADKYGQIIVQFIYAGSALHQRDRSRGTAAISLTQPVGPKRMKFTQEARNTLTTPSIKCQLAEYSGVVTKPLRGY
jgi:hypothetical protein